MGELIDEDVQGVTLSCDESLGTTSGNTFKAGGNVSGGFLTATLGEMTATVPVRIIAAKPAITLHPILIDSRDYPIEVTATVNANTYFYDPSTLDWSLYNEDVVTLNQGVLRGTTNGSTMLACNVGEYSDSTDVTVEISPETYLYQPWDGWTFKGTGAKNIEIDEATGNVTFTYSNNRAPYLQMSKDITLYSLPDTVALVFNSTMPIDYVQIDARNRYNTTSNFLRIDPQDGDLFETGVDYKILLDLDALGGSENVGTYPITLKSIKFTLNKGGETGDHTLALKSLYCHYSNTSAPHGITGDVNGDSEVNIADINAVIDVILTGAMTTSADVNGDGEINIADINAVIDIILNT